MKPRLKSSASGFSLIELMIAITVLGISLALAMPSYRAWIQNTQIRNAAESIQHGMQRARAEAVSRNTNVSFMLGGAAFWTVTDLASLDVIETASSSEISANVTPTTTPADTSLITFSNLGTVIPNTDVPVTASITQIDIDSSGLPAADSRELRITVGVGGGVRMCDPNVAVTTDLRYCLP